jgi:hypothetical protein
MQKTVYQAVMAANLAKLRKKGVIIGYWLLIIGSSVGANNN